MTKRLESIPAQDGITGLFFAALGVVSIYWSTDYAGASGFYPRVLGAVLLALGLLLAARSYRRSKQTSESRRMVDSPRHFLTVVSIMAIYLLLIPMIGFYTSSLLVLLVLPIALGFKRAVPLGICTLLFISILYLLFSIVLQKPLPREFFQI